MINKNLPTKLFLNGPELSFTTQPGDVTTTASSGIATFTGIATATFPAGSNGVSDGSITFDWYYDGSKITDNIETVGTASTLTLSGLVAADNLKEVYTIANYTPTAYSQPTGSDVTAGTARSTGNALNEPVQSNIVTITIEPEITIDTQPTDSTLAAGLDHTYTIAASVAPAGPTLSYQWQIDDVDLVDGVNTLTFTSGATAVTISGATTTTLTVNSDTPSISGNVKCVVSALTDGTHADNSPLDSDEVLFDNVTPRDILNFEAYGTTSLATIKGYTLYEESDRRDVILSPTAIYQDQPNAKPALTNFSSNDIAFYAPEKDVYVEMEIRAGAGADSKRRDGGEGGYSKIRFTANKNDEYIIRGLESSSAIFLYRKANLIAVVGEGGSGAAFSDGGNGGGILQAGGDAGRRNNSGGPGGTKIADGALEENGTWGGRANPSEVYPEDNELPGTASGQTIKCSKGVYWRDQGLSACADINGLTQFRLSDGTLVTNSGEINRGFKAGYAINSTGGAGNADGSGKGGHGATGGRGDTGGNGGGGGSGYTDGSLTYVVESTLGGNTGDASVILRLATVATDPVPVPPPPVERNVRWTVTRNAGDSNTVTFSKQSGIGPSSITWGPNSGNINTLIGAGAVYTFSSATFSGGRGLNRRLTGNTLEMDDVGDNDYNDLTVSPDQGRFTSDSRWEANW